MKLATLAAATLAWTPVAFAQTPTVVSPAEALTGTRFLSNTYPFSVGPSTYQQVHSSGSFTVASPRTVSVLRVRPVTTPAAASTDLLLRMADCPHGSNSASATYASNVTTGTDTLVFTRKIVNLPVQTVPGWTLSFPFDAPFAWSGSHLSWYCQVFGNSAGGTNLGHAFDAWDAHGDVFYSAQPGCASALGTGTPLMGARVEPPGGTATFTALSYVPAGGLPTALLIGATPLSIDLTPLGATGCTLTTDPLAIAYGTTMASPTGLARFTIPIPSTPALAGTSFRAQAAFVQAGSNPFGIFATEGLTCGFGVDPRVTRIFGGAGQSSGTLETMNGIAIALD